MMTAHPPDDDARKSLKEILLAETPRADIPVPQRGRLRARIRPDFDQAEAPD